MDFIDKNETIKNYVTEFDLEFEINIDQSEFQQISFGDKFYPHCSLLPQIYTKSLLFKRWKQTNRKLRKESLDKHYYDLQWKLALQEMKLICEGNSDKLNLFYEVTKNIMNYREKAKEAKRKLRKKIKERESW